MDKIIIRKEKLNVKKDIKLFLRCWNISKNKPSALLLILHGLGGHSDYYSHFGQLLAESGALVCSYDRRGHGRSDGKRGDIESFDIDMDDLNDIIILLQQNYPNTKIYFFGESWGCLIALYYLYKQSNNQVFGLILSSPPIKLNVQTSWLKPFLKSSFEFIADILTLHFDAKLGAIFPLELASRDKGFFEKLYTDKYTNLKMSLHYGLLLMSLFKKAKFYASTLNIPTLILQGESDKILVPDGAKELYETIPSSDKELVIIKEAYHTLYFDPQTPVVIETIIRWLLKHQYLYEN